MKKLYIKYIVVLLGIPFLFLGTAFSSNAIDDLYQEIDLSSLDSSPNLEKKLFNKKLNNNPNYKKRSLMLSLYNKNQYYTQSIFENLKYGNIDIKTAIQKAVQEVSSPFIQLKEKDSSKFKLINTPVQPSMNPSIDSKEYTLSLGGFPLCDGNLVVHSYRSLDYPLVFGEAREIDVDFIPSLSNFPDSLKTKDLIFNKVKEKYSGNINIEEEEPCLFVRENKVIPAFRYELRLNRKAYKIVSDGIGILDLKKNFFNVNGTATIYDRNRNNGLKSFTLYNLDGSGYLKSEHFVTTAINRAYAENNNFTFTPDTAEFLETSVFTNVQDHYLWFNSLGFNWYSKYKINLVPDAIISNDINNAYFLPESDSTPPSIQVGKGDGTTFKDLMIDRDVVSHEFGHFVVYSKLKNAEEGSESLVLHEGLADFFVMIRNSNPCFASSICTQYSPGCSNGCLRSADNTILATDNISQSHIKSQFLSGMLWDLKIKDGIPDADLINLVLKSIFLLGESSGYKDFMTSLLLVDLSTYNLKYCSTILQRAKARGLTNYVSDLRCDSSSLGGIYVQPDGPVTSASSSSSSSSHSFCGSIKQFNSGNSDGNNFKNNMFNFIIMMIPTMLGTVGFIRKKYSPIQ